MTQPPHPANYTYLPSSRGKWLRRSVLVIVFVSLAILFLQASRPRFSNAKDNIPWRTNLTDALAEARKTGKPLLVDFSATWCPPCQEMKHASWPDPKVEDAVKKNYIPVLLDADDPQSEDPAKRYQAIYLPTILILDPNGNVVQSGGVMTASELLDFLTPHKPDKPKSQAGNSDSRPS